MVKNKSYSSTCAPLLLAIIVSMGLSACSTLDETFGLAKHSPDESQVITHEPLVAPQVATLPQPGEGVDRTIVPEPVDKTDEIRRQLEEEKRRGIIHEGATPETVAHIQAKKDEDDEPEPPKAQAGRSEQSQPEQAQLEKEKPWWKIW